jgi:hypothetical protein
MATQHDPRTKSAELPLTAFELPKFVRRVSPSKVGQERAKGGCENHLTLRSVGQRGRWRSCSGTWKLRVADRRHAAQP